MDMLDSWGLEEFEVKEQGKKRSRLILINWATQLVQMILYINPGWSYLCKKHMSYVIYKIVRRSGKFSFRLAQNLNEQAKQTFH